jgi:MFS family permease
VSQPALDPHAHRSGRLWPAYLASFTFMLGQWSCGVAVPLLVVALGGSLAEAGIIAAIRFGLGAVFSLPFGAIADAWGTRRTLFTSIAGNALVNLVPLLAVAGDAVLPLYAWAVLSGLTSSLFLPANAAYVAGTARPEARGRAFGWVTLATHSGVALGPAIGGLAWDSLGQAPTFVIASLLGATALVAPMFVPRSIRSRVDLRGLPSMIGVVARDRVIVGSWMAALAIGLPWGAVTGLFPLFGTSIGLSASAVGLLLGLQSATNGISRIPLGWLVDRRRPVPLAAAGGAAVYASVNALLGFQEGPLGIALIFVGGIVALAFTLMLVQVTISERAPENLRATGLGGYSTFLSAGLGIGPFLAGTAAQAAGFDIGFAVAAAAGLVAVIVAAVLLARAPAPSVRSPAA